MTSEKNDKSILTSWRGVTKFEAHKTKKKNADKFQNNIIKNQV